MPPSELRPRPRATVIDRAEDANLLHHPLSRTKHRSQESYAAADCGFDGAFLLIRALVAFAGALVVFVGIYSMYPFTLKLRFLPITTLKFYMIFFGLTVLMLEGKALLPEHHQLRQWFYTEFRFVHGLRGKGFYYLLVGILSVALSNEHWMFMACGAAIAVMGCANLGLSFVSRRQLQDTGLTVSDFHTTTKLRDKRHHHHHHHRHLNEPLPIAGEQSEPLIHYYAPGLELGQGHSASIPTFPMLNRSEVIDMSAAPIPPSAPPAPPPMPMKAPSPILYYEPAAESLPSSAAIGVQQLGLSRSLGPNVPPMSSYSDPLKFTSYIHS